MLPEVESGSTGDDKSEIGISALHMSVVTFKFLIHHNVACGKQLCWFNSAPKVNRGVVGGG
jgi:hypothetical protein